MTPMNPQSESPLFSKLIPEIRAKIYEFHLDDLQNFPPRESLPVRYWMFSKRPEMAFLAAGEVHGDLPDLLITCKRVFNELAPSVFDHFSISARLMGWNLRTGLGVFGNLDLAHKRKLTIINHPSTKMPDWLSFFRDVTSYPAATQLEELVLDWRQTVDLDLQTDGAEADQLLERISEEQKTELLLHITSLKALKLIKLWGNCPTWWADFLRENSVSAARVICE